MFHCLQDLRALQLVPRRRDDRRVRIVLAQHGDALRDLFLRQVRRPAQHNAVRILHLVIKELAKVFHVHPALLCVNDRCKAVKRDLRGIDPLYRADYIA